jgi:hypothetical protein
MVEFSRTGTGKTGVCARKWGSDSPPQGEAVGVKVEVFRVIVRLLANV